MRILIVFYMAFLLSGCAKMQKFECPMDGGINCKSLSDIDSMIDEKKKRKGAGVVRGHHDSGVITKTKGVNQQRIPEEVLEVSISPYVSNDGILHHAKVISVVVSESRWG